MHVHERLPAVAATMLHMFKPYEPLPIDARVVSSELSVATLRCEIALTPCFFPVSIGRRRVSVL